MDAAPAADYAGHGWLAVVVDVSGLDAAVVGFGGYNGSRGVVGAVAVVAFAAVAADVGGAGGGGAVAVGRPRSRRTPEPGRRPLVDG